MIYLVQNFLFLKKHYEVLREFIRQNTPKKRKNLEHIV